MDSTAKGLYGAPLALGPLCGLSAELVKWRESNEISAIYQAQSRNRIFDFVKGLRFSAQLIYFIRERLPAHQIAVDWGQLVSEDGTSLSPECDIIIHRNGVFKKWNGDRNNPIMNFAFIKSNSVLAIVSCKSYLRSVGKKHTEYIENIRKVAPNKRLWLFAECCAPGRIGKLKADALSAGYNGFWYLYTWDSKRSYSTNDESIWADFIHSLATLGE